MGLWDKLTGEFVDIIEWTDDSQDTMVWRFERHGNEIKYGAQLTVRESQVAVFVNEGQIADVFFPGRYVLETQNIPILSTLQGWKHGFESPFKAEVYFVNTRRFTDLKWGTKNPVMMRDPEFGPVRLRAFGTYEIRVADSGAFLREIVGTDGHFTTDEVTDQLRNLIVSRFSQEVGGSGIPVLDLAGNYDQLSTFVTNKIAPDFGQYGLELTKLLVENVSLPEGRGTSHGPAHPDGRDRRFVPLQPVPGRRGLARRRRQPRCGHHHGAGRRHGHGQPDGRCTASRRRPLGHPPGRARRARHQHRLPRRDRRRCRRPRPSILPRSNGQQAGPFDGGRICRARSDQLAR